MYSIYSIQLQGHNAVYGLTKNRDVEMGVSVIDRGFKRNLAQLTDRYDLKFVQLYLVLNRASITEPFSATCGCKISSLRRAILTTNALPAIEYGPTNPAFLSWNVTSTFPSLSDITLPRSPTCLILSFLSP